MEPVIKTHKGIELSFTMERHNKESNKLWVGFDLSGTKYRNGQLLPSAATGRPVDAVLGSLEEWAQTIINDHISG